MFLSAVHKAHRLMRHNLSMEISNKKRIKKYRPIKIYETVITNITE